MAKKAPLSVDRASRRITWYAEEDGKSFTYTEQDATHIAEAAKVLAEVPPDPETGWRFVCAIPEAVLNQSMIEGWFHDKAAWRKWARNPDNRAFNGGRENPF
jgi:hypothetical protein